MHIFMRLWKQLSEMDFRVIAILSAFIILFGTFSVYWIEPETFPTLFDSFWWTMTTLTTVGYGDFFPMTVAGRLVGIFLFIFGIGLIRVLIGKIVEAASTYQRLKKEGRLMYKKAGIMSISAGRKKLSRQLKKCFTIITVLKLFWWKIRPRPLFLMIKSILSVAIRRKRGFCIKQISLKRRE
ncbi:potassium channel family protein [Jeotgalibacillus malaysiensis]|uniref:potassium channel family protein n=1 Tax=Jeotgalibacillus malaysiensis TaxID=1508404 RepID=UPI00384A79FB